MRGVFPILLAFTISACQQAENESQDQAFESLIRAERAFAETSLRSGARAAFLEFLAEDAVLFDAGPVDGRTLWEARAESDAVLSWGPEIAGVAAAGDMGFTSGPWELRARPDTAPVSWGHFVSVWRKDAEGRWKVAADGGITHGPVPVSHEGPVTPFGSIVAATSRTRYVDVGVAWAALAEIDSEYSRAVAERGFTGSVDRFLGSAARFYRNGHPPVIGRDAIVESPPVQETVWADGEQRHAKVSSSGDLGFTCGVVQFPVEEVSDSPAMASYYRIWTQAVGSQWSVVIDVLIPYPPRP